ncbi:CHAD domain-containing protein [Burkholderia sp. Ax-1719]|uniref:CHAD domain-containing protein n=1 Tax=Burkholderia sp. Ax-1719 TaxID=2608334 RepID=UPI00142111F8|nr:CHAD domain-containing protein [Burkholderia sp. Ax-1719]NIE62889.1 CHAD domain-containing protein [Burkholderia sp. Ax-1719]
MKPGKRKPVKPRHDAQARFSGYAKPLVDEALRHSAHLDPSADDFHKLRVALRRLRTLLWVWRPLLKRDMAELERGYLKRVGAAAGSARDWDIAAQMLDELDSDGATVAAERLNAARLAARDSACATLTAADLRHALREMLHKVNQALNTAPRRASIEDLAQNSVRAARRDLKKCVRRAGKAAKSDYAAWHDVRKAAKKLRYTLEFFAPILPRRDAKRLKPLKRLQKRFGYLNDAVASERLLNEHREIFADDASADSTLAALRQDRKRLQRRAAKLIGA